MKRGYPRGNQGGSNGGPLVTNHLRDLDIELQLLKRKRLMIEQQQRLLSNDIYDQQPYLHDQPQYDQHQNYGQNRNYSHLYDDGHQGGMSMDSQFGKSYQAVGPNWKSNQQNTQYEDNHNFSSNRNSYAPKARNNPKFNFAPKNKNFNQQNKFNSPFKYDTPNKSTNVRKDFKPAKVTKPKNTVTNPLRKLENLPVGTRTKLVKSAVPLTKQDKDFWTLKPNVQPNPKLLGRMELALGMLLKEARERFAEQYADFFTNTQYQRELKKELRIRIRTVLMGKVVPQLQQIVQMYRRQYPQETDKHLFDLCEARKQSNIFPKGLPNQKFLPAEDPAKFFKINFNKSIAKQMEKLCQKLIEIQEDQNKRSFEDIIAELPDMFEITHTSEKANKVLEKSKDSDAKVDEGNTENAETTNENSKPSEETPKPSDETSKPSDETPKPTEETPKPTEETPKTTEETPKPTEETPKSSEITPENGDVVETDKTENATAEDDDVVIIEKEIFDPQKKIKFYTGLIDQLIEKRLPHFLRQRSNELVHKIIDADKVFSASRAGVLIEATRKAEKLCNLPIDIKFWDYKDTSKPVQKEKQDQTAKASGPVGKLSHFVKVVGKPNLPEKKIMKTFIDNYNPKSIKKHKHIHNLLFIGFGCKEDMDNILKENGKTVGTSKLIIKVSDKLHGGTSNDKQNEDAANVTDSSILKTEQENGKDGEEKPAENTENIGENAETTETNGTNSVLPETEAVVTESETSADVTQTTQVGEKKDEVQNV